MTKKSHFESYEQTDIQLDSFERKIAQKLMISVRYFCSDKNENAQSQNDNPADINYLKKPFSTEQCKLPVTKLPDELAKLIEQTSLGGVVLFAENINSPEQVIQLTHQLQMAASGSKVEKPLLIGIDQEGGRVVRLQRQQSTAFSGNMAIGATYPQKGTYYAEQVGRIIAQELSVLGINLNFSPDVDVNSNPDNPVINVRSFGEDPTLVSELGIAMMNSMQKQNVIATLKHFPGHGNTSVDSHSGLPLVSNEKLVIEQTDLLPFKTAIEKGDPGMIMTAHIQYPALDDSKLIDFNGDPIIKPATMSKVILTDLLRQDFGFKGVVITDALNMAGISNHFKMSTATATTILAGADIALMPFRVRTQADIYRFKHFIRAVAEEIRQKPENIDIVEESLSRIDELRKKYQIEEFPKNYFTPKNLEYRFKQADRILASDASKKIEKNLARDAISLIKNDAGILPLSQQASKNIHLILQDNEQLSVVGQALKELQVSYQMKTNISYSLLTDSNLPETKKNIAKSQTVIAFYSSRRESAVIKGEVDDLAGVITNAEEEQELRLYNLKSALIFAKKLHKNVIVAGMQSPYDMRGFDELADSIIVAYDASIFSSTVNNKMDLVDDQLLRSPSSENSEKEELFGVTYDAVVEAIFGRYPFDGKLPVSLELRPKYKHTQPAN